MKNSLPIKSEKSNLFNNNFSKKIDDSNNILLNINQTSQSSIKKA